MNTASVQRWRRWWPLAVAAVALLAILLLSGRGWRPSTAQNDRGAVPRQITTSYAFVGAGDCQTLGESRFVLDGRSGASRGDRIGSADAATVSYAMSQIPARLDDLVETPHVVVVLPEAGTAEQWSACGEIGGFVDDDGLVIGLRPSGGDGLAGIAILWDDRDTIEVELYLAEEIVPAASPTAGA